MYKTTAYNSKIDQLNPAAEPKAQTALLRLYHICVAVKMEHTVGIQIGHVIQKC